MSGNFLADQQSKLRVQTDRATMLFDSLNDEQMNWRPRPNSWSVAECLEHLTSGADEYLPKINESIAKQRTGDSAVRPKPSLVGGMLLKAVDPNTVKPMKAPKIFTPPSDIASGSLDRFQTAHEALGMAIESAEGLDLKRSRVISPVAAFFRMNLADAFEMLVNHVERHLNQAERVTQSDGFPV